MTGWWRERTLADDLRESPRPVDTTPHAHFHGHGPGRHSHVHVHPEAHAHSARSDAVHRCWLCGRADDGVGVNVNIEGVIRWMCSYCDDMTTDERGGDDR